MTSPNGRPAGANAGGTATPARRLEITLEPRELWSYDLRAALGEDLWRQLECAAQCDTGGRCQVCGGANPTLQPRWKYDERRGLRTLLGFEVICSQCYYGRHPGHASAVLGAAELDAINTHYRQVNGIDSDSEWLADLDAAFAEWHRRNQIRWRTELGSWQVFAGGRRHAG